MSSVQDNIPINMIVKNFSGINISNFISYCQYFSEILFHIILLIFAVEISALKVYNPKHAKNSRNTMDFLEYNQKGI